MSFLLRDAVGIHARVRSSSGVRAPLAPAPRESWGTVRSHEPRRGTPLWGEGNRPKRQEARGAGGLAGGRGRLLCAATVPSCPVMVLPPQLSADSGPPSVPAEPLEGAWVPESELGAGGDSAPLWGLRLPKWQPLGQAKTLPAHLESVWQLLSPGALPVGRRGLAVAARRPSGMLISVLTGGSFLGNLSQSFGRNGAVPLPVFGSCC